MKRSSRRPFAVAGLLAVVALLAGLAAPACGSPFPPLFTQNGGEDAGVVSDARVPILTPGCTGFECSVVTCADGGSTTVSGTVYDPAGNNPLYNVVVYVPSSTPGPLPTGASCNSCDSLYLGRPGRRGRHRRDREVHDPERAVGDVNPARHPDRKVAQADHGRERDCLHGQPDHDEADSPLAARAEGDLPNIAISTGGADSLECLLRRIGVDRVGVRAGRGRAGAHPHLPGLEQPRRRWPSGAATTSPAAPYSSEALWNSLANLMPYDITILSCEGAETVDQPARRPAQGERSAEPPRVHVGRGARVRVALPLRLVRHGSVRRREHRDVDARGEPDHRGEQQPGLDLLRRLHLREHPHDARRRRRRSRRGSSSTSGSAPSARSNSPAATQAPGELVITGAKHNADLAGAGGHAVAGVDRRGQERGDRGHIPPALDAGPVASVAGATEYLSFNTPWTQGSMTRASRPTAVASSTATCTSARRRGTTAGKGPAGSSPPDARTTRCRLRSSALEFMLFDLSSCVTPDNGAAQQPIPGPIK